jgi:hypothetical protein
LPWIASVTVKYVRDQTSIPASARLFHRCARRPSSERFVSFQLSANGRGGVLLRWRPDKSMHVRAVEGEEGELKQLLAS